MTNTPEQPDHAELKFEARSDDDPNVILRIMEDSQGDVWLSLIGDKGWQSFRACTSQGGGKNLELRKHLSGFLTRALAEPDKVDVEYDQRVSYLHDCYRNGRAPTYETVQFFKQYSRNLIPPVEPVRGDALKPLVWKDYADRTEKYHRAKSAAGYYEVEATDAICHLFLPNNNGRPCGQYESPDEAKAEAQKHYSNFMKPYLSALSQSPAPVEPVRGDITGEMFYMAMYGDEGAIWSANENQDLWDKKAQKLNAALSQSLDKIVERLEGLRRKYEPTVDFDLVAIEASNDTLDAAISIIEAVKQAGRG